MSTLVFRMVCIVLPLLSVFTETSISGQTVDKYYSKPPVQIASIEKGLTDINHLRTTLIEAGLRFKEAETQERGTSEIWTFGHEDITIDDPLEGRIILPLISVQISEWHLDEGGRIKYVRFSILSDYLPQYAEKFLTSIKSFYPYKEPIPVEVTQGDKVKTEYQLRYSKKESNVYVDFEIDEYNWYNFHFYLDIL